MSYNPYRKYCSRWWKFWTYVPGDIWDFIVRLYDYAPLLWEDRDWDHAHLLRMMRFKINRMRHHMETHAIIAHAEDHVAEMAQAEVMLRNIDDEDPDDEWSMHWNQWHVSLKDFNDCKDPLGCQKALRATHRRERRNWHGLWKHLDKYMQGWWD
jgi:hypothetical protein